MLQDNCLENITIAQLRDIGIHYLQEVINDAKETTHIVSLLLIHLCNYSLFSDLIIHANKAVPAETAKEFFALLKRKKDGEPIQYIVGHVSFMNTHLEVSRYCLIPRPETEQLVEHVLHWMLKRKCVETILDVGTGSGNIAIAIACCYSNAIIDAIDISENALAIARKNAGQNGVAHAISFYHSVLFDAVPEKKRYTIVVSNPPYVAPEEFATAQRELQWEPYEALVAQENGLAIIAKIIEKTIEHLDNNGALFLEIGSKQGAAVKKLLEYHGYKNSAILKDYAGHDRFAVGLKGSNYHG